MAYDDEIKDYMIEPPRERPEPSLQRASGDCYFVECGLDSTRMMEVVCAAFYDYKPETIYYTVVNLWDEDSKGQMNKLIAEDSNAIALLTRQEREALDAFVRRKAEPAWEQ